MSETKGAKHGKKSPRHSEKKQCNRFFNAVLCVVVIVLLIFGGISVYANNYKGIYPNTLIYGVNVSDLTESELRTYINGKYTRENVAGAEITVQCEDNREKIDINKLNVSFDNDAFIYNICNSGKNEGFVANTINFIKRLFASENVEPVISYDKSAAEDTFNSAAGGIETEPVGHTFIIGDDKVTVNGPVNGYVASREKAFADLENRIKTMDYSDIVMKPEYVSAEPLDFDEFYTWLTSDVENAYYEKVDGVVKVHESKAKVEVSRQEVKDALEHLKESAENTIDIYATITQPEISTTMLENQLYSNKLASYSTNFGGSSVARANNVKLAASRINGTELMPDEEFSYDKTILPRTTENGYMAAPVYVGNKVESGMGGGICQPSSTLYAAALYANLEIAERHNHSMKVGYISPGIDATIAEGYLDLRLKNSTGYPIKIVATTDGGVLAFSIMGYNPDNIKAELIITSNGNNYYVTRVVKCDGAEIKRESMRSSSYVEPEKTEEEKKAEEEKKRISEQKEKEKSKAEDVKPGNAETSSEKVSATSDNKVGETESSTATSLPPDGTPSTGDEE